MPWTRWNQGTFAIHHVSTVLASSYLVGGGGAGEMREMIMVMTSQCKGEQYPDAITRSFIFDKGCPQPVGLLHRCGGCHGGSISEL